MVNHIQLLHYSKYGTWLPTYNFYTIVTYGTWLPTYNFYTIVTLIIWYMVTYIQLLHYSNSYNMVHGYLHTTFTL